MKKIFTCFALAALAGAAATDASAQTRPEGTDLRPNEPKGTFCQWNLKEGCPGGEITISVQLPTTGVWRDDNWTYHEEEIQEELTLTVSRSCYDVGEYSLELPSLTGMPGEVVTFTDSDGLQTGYNYQYDIRTVLGNAISYGFYQGVYTGKKLGNAVFKVTTEERGQLPVTISVTAPTQYEDGTEIPDGVTMDATLYRSTAGYLSDTDALLTIEDMVPGQVFTMEDEEAELNKKYRYGLQLANDLGKSDRQTVDVLVGMDRPGSIYELKVSFNEQGLPVITWEAPMYSADGGWIDFDAIRYRVERQIGYSGPTTLLAEDLAECTYTDTLEGLDHEIKFRYRVTPYNETGDGYASTTYDEIVAGPASQLPFHETFGVGSYSPTPDYIWSTTDLYSWGTASYDWNNTDIAGFRAMDEESADYVENDGYLYISYGSYDSAGYESTYETGKIDIDGVKSAILSFYYWMAPTNHNIQMEITLEDGTMRTVTSLVPEDFPADESEPGYWTLRTAPITDIEGNAWMKLRIRAIASGTTSKIFFDEITITDSTVTGIQGNTDAQVVETEYYTADGLRTAAPAKGAFTIKVMKMADGSVKTAKTVVK